MNLFRKTVVVTFFSLIGFGFCGQSWGADWVFYYKTEIENGNKIETLKYYFDKSTVEKPQKNFVKVTQKVTLVGTGDDETDRRVMQMEINCSSRKCRVVSRTEFEEGSGKAITEDQSGSTVWKQFYEDSPVGGLFQNLCFEKKQKKEPERKPDRQPDKPDKETDKKAEKQKEPAK